MVLLSFFSDGCQLYLGKNSFYLHRRSRSYPTTMQVCRNQLTGFDYLPFFTKKSVVKWMELEFAGGLFTLFGTGLDWLKWINSFVIRSIRPSESTKRRQFVPKGRGRGSLEADILELSSGTGGATSCVLVPTTDHNHRWGIARPSQ